MVAILVGIIFVGVGFWSLINWSNDFLLVIKGLLPFSLIVGGLVGILAGISALRSRRKSNGSK